MRDFFAMEGIGLRWEIEGWGVNKEGVGYRIPSETEGMEFNENNNKHETWHLEAGNKNPIELIEFCCEVEMGKDGYRKIF
jgi:hypothetical protein